MVLSEMGLTIAKTQRDVFATRSCVIQFGVKVVNDCATFDAKSQMSLTCKKCFDRMLKTKRRKNIVEKKLKWVQNL